MKKKLLVHALGFNFPGAAQILLKMKLTVFILVLSFIGAIASESYAQTKLSLDLKNTTVRDALDAIENQSEFFFLYSEKLIDVNRKVDIDVQQSTVDKILDKVFYGTTVQYAVKDRQIVLTTPEANLPEGTTSGTQQQKSVSGKVTDSTGGSLPGVSVVVKGSTKGVITDNNGSYLITNIPDNATLQFSFVGMKTLEAAVGSKTTLNITLAEESIGLEEVVAIGYGTSKKSDLTGAVSSVRGSSLNGVATSRVVEALQGKVAGVSIVKGSGRPGDGVKIRIRGVGTINNSDPLYVIDGVPSGNMDNIDQNDVQSLEILKDASSTAIYGSRGANGVVLVTTKTGTMKDKTVFAVNSYLSFDHVKQLDILNGYEWAQMYQEAATNDNTPFIGEKLKLINDAIANKTVGTNWQDEVFQTGMTQNHQISATGGLEGKSGKGLKYYISGSYNDNKGTLKFTGFNRYNILSKLEIKLSKKVAMGAEITFNTINSIGSDAINAFDDPLGNALQSIPLMPVKNADGSWGNMWFNDGQDNVAQAITRSQDFKTKNLEYGTKGWLQVDIIDGLTFKTIYNYSNSFRHSKNFSPSFYINARKNNSTSSLSEGRYETSGWYWNNLLTYEKIFASDHDVKFTIGHEATYRKNDGFNIVATSGVSVDPNLHYINRASTWGNPTVNVGESGMESVFGRLSYSYKSKYILNSIVRRDGSYKFSDQNKWGTFPSIGLAWRTSEENFMKNIPFINSLKIRANWGKVGNESSADAYSYLSTVNISNMYYSINGNAVNQGGIPTSTVNPDLKWESVESSNIGVDLGIFKNKLTVSADYYIKNTKDMIVQVPVPSYTSNSEPFVNVGAMKNTGFEISASYSEQIGDLSFSLNGNISFINNKVTDLGSKGYIQGGAINNQVDPQYITRTEVGKEIAHFIGFDYTGIYQTQAEIDLDAFPNASKITIGDARYADKNGDHVLDSKDYLDLGSAIPDFTYGMSGNISYRNWDLSVNVIGTQGNEIANMLTPRISTGENYSNLTVKRLDRYSAENNPTGTEPKMTINNPNRNWFKMSNQNIEDGSFLKIKTVQLGYTLPKSLISKLKLTNLRVYVTGQNLFTVTKYTGFDPEISDYTPGNASNTSLAAGIDLANYPIPKSYIAGLNITF